MGQVQGLGYPLRGELPHLRLKELSPVLAPCSAEVSPGSQWSEEAPRAANLSPETSVALGGAGGPDLHAFLPF